MGHSFPDPRAVGLFLCGAKVSHLPGTPCCCLGPWGRAGRGCPQVADPHVFLGLLFCKLGVQGLQLSQSPALSEARLDMALGQRAVAPWPSLLFAPWGPSSVPL